VVVVLGLVGDVEPHREDLAGQQGRVEGREAGALRPAVAEWRDRPHRRPIQPRVDPGDVDDVGDLLPADRHGRAGERSGVDDGEVLVEHGDATEHGTVLVIGGE
jgi:hypothetical protein